MNLRPLFVSLLLVFTTSYICAQADKEKLHIVNLKITTPNEAKAAVSSKYDAGRKSVAVDILDTLALLEEISTYDVEIEANDCFIPELKLIYKLAQKF